MEEKCFYCGAKVEGTLVDCYHDGTPIDTTLVCSLHGELYEHPDRYGDQRPSYYYHDYFYRTLAEASRHTY